MPIAIAVPTLIPGVTEGTLTRWLKKAGDAVTTGDVLAEIETDLATIEIEATANGMLGEVLVPAGTTGVTAGTDIAMLMEADGAKPPSAALAEAHPPPAPPATTLATTPAGPPQAGRHADPRAAPRHTAIPNSGMRKVIARRLSEAKRTVPHFYLTVDMRLDALLAMRAELNSRPDAHKLSVNDFIIRAVALALTSVPAANASWTDESILRYDHADVSVAVATPTGLITPIIRKAEHKGLAQISAEMKDLAKRARDGKLRPEEFQGGSFSISNLGMFGIREFAAIINPPQGCILAVGAGERRPVVKGDGLAIATMMTCTLSVDHRVVDGAVGAEFLKALKALVEEPLLFMV